MRRCPARLAVSVAVLAAVTVKSQVAAPRSQPATLRGQAAASGTQAPTIPGQVAAAHLARITFDNYCAGCHSERRHTAGMVIKPEGVTTVGADPERWEKIVRKLRAGTMPPPDRSRPDQSTYDAVAAYLESELDKAATRRPNVGNVPPLHRLTRTEYQNAVRDLIGLDALPKELDYSVILPPDNTGSGFDNVADLLFISPTAMDSYLNASEKISAMAVGSMSTPVMVNMYRLPDEQPQGARVDGLPVGTRGGIAVRSHFPLDAEYVIKVDFAGRSSQPQQLEITVDGARARLIDVSAASGGRFGGGRGGGGGGRGGGRGAAAGGAGDDDPAAPAPASDGEAANAGRTPEFRLPISAGPHLIGVTFIERNELRDEETLRPRMRGTGTELAVETVTISGPYNAKGSGDTAARRRIFVCRPTAAVPEAACAQRILSTLARRAFRRPVTAADVEPLMPFYRAGRAEGGFDRGIERALQRLLVSPQFLFRIERDPPTVPAGTPHPISDLELASRLSFFLWSSVPDDELLTLASQGRLRQPGVTEQQVRRMLADPRSATLVTNFGEQWLFLRDLFSKKPNEILFPDFDETLRDAFYRETTMFMDNVLRGGRSVLELLSADYTFVNERLAKFYGFPNIHGSDFRRVTFPAGSPRGGLLGQGSILTITSYANRTSPVNRGKWVLDNLLSSPPPAPPPNVPALKTESAGNGAPLPMRQAMIQHRADPACASCHSRMDPIGFAMENFDAVGLWRERDAGTPIDATGVFPSGVAFTGMAGLKTALLSRPDEFVSTIAEKLLMYSIGRNVQYFDQPAIRAIVRESAKSDYTFTSLVLGVVKSAPFRMRQAAPKHN